MNAFVQTQSQALLSRSLFGRGAGCPLEMEIELYDHNVEERKKLAKSITPAHCLHWFAMHFIATCQPLEPQATKFFEILEPANERLASIVRIFPFKYSTFSTLHTEHKKTLRDLLRPLRTPVGRY